MALIFPSNPTLNQVFSTGSLSWTWNGKSWNNGTSILATSNLVSSSVQFTNGNTNAFDTTSNITVGQITASFAKISGSIFGTASFATNAFSASYAPNIYVLPSNVVSSSAQHANGGGVSFDTNTNITVGQITASFAKITNLTVEYVTSSVMVITGSNKFGDASNDKQEFTGSVSISGSLSVSGDVTFSATNNRIVATDNTSYTSWQGASTQQNRGYFIQRENDNAGFFGLSAGSNRSIVFEGNILGGTFASKTATPNNSTVRMRFNGYDTTNGVSLGAAEFRLVATEDWTSTAHGTKADVIVTPTGSVTSSIAATFNSNGNVGIGTATPSAKLHISNGTVTEPAWTSGDLVILSGTQNALLQLHSPTSGIGGIQFSDTTRLMGYIRYSHGDDSMRFWTGGTEKAVIDASGSVGIGTTTPEGKLHISTTGTSFPESWEDNLKLSGQYPAMYFHDTSSNNGYIIGQDIGTLHFMSVSSGSLGTYTMMLTNSGNVGIGTTSPAYKLDVSGSVADSIGNVRLLPQNSKSTDYTTVLSDSGKHILHPSADTTARTFTIDSNANVAYAIGTAITFVNQNAAGVLTISITSDTMRLAGAGTTGNRTLAANGVATAVKITSTEWIISGTGLT